MIFKLNDVQIKWNYFNFLTNVVGCLENMALEYEWYLQ